MDCYKFLLNKPTWTYILGNKFQDVENFDLDQSSIDLFQNVVDQLSKHEYENLKRFINSKLFKFNSTTIQDINLRLYDNDMELQHMLLILLHYYYCF